MTEEKMNEKIKNMDATIYQLQIEVDKKDELIKGLREEHLKQTMNLKRTIEELTNENRALNAVRRELEETVKRLNQTNSNVLESNKALIGGVVMIISMLGRGMNNHEGD